MADKARRLGRGLDFLLSKEAEESTPQPAKEIDLERIRSNPWQPRKAFDGAALDALADSIRQHGVIQPISVRAQGDDFELVAGERRLLAARKAGLRSIPAVVRDLDDGQMLVVALVENLQREDLNPIDRARALRQLVDEQGKSHEEVALLAGMARSTVTNSIRLLDLDTDSIAALTDGRISEGHARALLAELDPVRRRELLESAVNNQLTVRNMEEQVTTKGGKKGKAKASADAQRLAKLLSERLRAKVKIEERGARGRIIVEYGSLAEFERLYEALAGEAPDVE
jgi:ParB family chromosome partitioning protein